MVLRLAGPRSARFTPPPPPVSGRVLAHLTLCLRRPKDLRRSYGAWAVVTGPTSGISRSMAMKLARAGLSLVLVGRDPAKLLVETNRVSSAVRRSFSPLFVLAPEDYTRAAVAWIGHGAVCVPSVAHRLQWWYASGLPESVHDATRLQQRAVFHRLRSWRKQKSTQ